MSVTPGHVAVLGGGLAGMSAAAALAQQGYRVTLIEKRASLGGRAGSHFDAATGEWFDNCQHVLMPCCTNLLDFYRRIGVESKIRFFPEIPFIHGNGLISRLKMSSLPAPFHCAPSFLTLKFLSPRDKIRIAWGLGALLAQGRAVEASGNALEWFISHGQSKRTIQNFWHLVLVSALNEDLGRASIKYAAKVFLDAFLFHSRGWQLGLPTVALSSLYGDGFVDLVKRHQGQVRFLTGVQRLLVRENRVTEVALATGDHLAADSFILALPWRSAMELVPEGALPSAQASLIRTLDASPITGIHLWFDRPVTTLDFAALPGKQIHWFFNKSRIFQRESCSGSYLLLVTSASRSWMDLTKGQILDIALKDLAEVLPGTREARLVKTHVLKEPMATFSPTPQSDECRPVSATKISNLFLAGDWTQTGWPATMEGAVRSGYLAAEAMLRSCGNRARLVVEPLPPSGFMRILR